MARTNWKELRAQRVESDAGLSVVIESERELVKAELRLADVRRRRHMSQDAVAEAMSISQPSVSKMERGADMHVSTVESYVRALGGRLEMLAVFDDEIVPIG